MAFSPWPKSLSTNKNAGLIFCLGFSVRINCHSTPNLSAVQPYFSDHGYLSRHMRTFPPRENVPHNSSISASFSQRTKYESEGENLNSGPPLRPIISWPARVNSTVMVEPAF